MTAIDPAIDKALETLVTEAADERPDWSQVGGRLGRTENANSRPIVRPRFAGRRAALALVIVAAAASVVLIGLPHGGHASVIARAIAAAGSGPVVHVVEPLEATNHTLIEVSTGTRLVARGETELWIDERRGMIHELVREDGAIVADDLLTRGATYSWESGRVLPASPAKYLAVPQALRGFATRYRDALASGAARIDREGTFDGSPVYWLRFEPREESDPYTKQITRFVDEVAIGRDSYKPLAVRTLVDGQAGPVTRVASIENVSRREANFERPELSPTPRGEDVVESKAITADDAPSVLGATPISAGDSVAGLKLTAIYTQTLKTWYPSTTGVAPVYSRGVVYVYGTTPGDLNHGREILPVGSLAIRESIKPEFFYGWQQNPRLPTPPSGLMRESGPYFVLKEGNVYVTIQARDEKRALTAARALKRSLPWDDTARSSSG